MTSITIQTSKGDITLLLNADKAPKTVENFLSYIDSGHFEDTIFHRVIKNFMIQGGGMTEDMHQKSTQRTIENEADNGLKNVRGSIAMARTMDPHSASSQFFINLVDNAFLDHTSKNAQGWGYCVFGAVTEGLSVIDDIAEVQTGQKAGHQDVPVESILIKNMVRS